MLEGAAKERRRGSGRIKGKMNDNQRLDTNVPKLQSLLGVIFWYILDLLRCAALTRTGLLKGVISAKLELETL